MTGAVDGLGQLERATEAAQEDAAPEGGDVLLRVVERLAEEEEVGVEEGEGAAVAAVALLRPWPFDPVPQLRVRKRRSVLCKVLVIDVLQKKVVDALRAGADRVRGRDRSLLREDRAEAPVRVDNVDGNNCGRVRDSARAPSLLPPQQLAGGPRHIYSRTREHAKMSTFSGRPGMPVERATFAYVYVPPGTVLLRASCSAQQLQVEGVGTLTSCTNLIELDPEERREAVHRAQLWWRGAGATRGSVLGADSLAQGNEGLVAPHEQLDVQIHDLEKRRRGEQHDKCWVRPCSAPSQSALTALAVHDKPAPSLTSSLSQAPGRRVRVSRRRSRMPAIDSPIMRSSLFPGARASATRAASSGLRGSRMAAARGTGRLPRETTSSRRRSGVVSSTHSAGASGGAAATRCASASAAARCAASATARSAYAAAAAAAASRDVRIESTAAMTTSAFTAVSAARAAAWAACRWSANCPTVGRARISPNCPMAGALENGTPPISVSAQIARFSSEISARSWA